MQISETILLTDVLLGAKQQPIIISARRRKEVECKLKALSRGLAVS